jgi:hypothetical protein
MHNTPECPCWHIVGELVDVNDATRLDHVCRNTAHGTVGLWVMREAGSLEHLFLGVLPDILLERVQQVMRAAFRQDWPWPLRESGRDLALVLRGWVQEEPNAGLAERLESYPLWQAARDWRRTLAQHPDAQPRDLLIQAGYLDEHERAEPGLLDRSAAGAAFMLRQAGVPSTPAAVAHLEASAAGLVGVLPARGVLLTTRVYVVQEEATGLWAHDGSPTMELEFPEAWAPKELLALAEDAVAAQRVWLERHMGWHPLTRLSVVRRAQAGSTARAERRRGNATDDYVASALSPADLDLLREQAPGHDRDGWADVIRRHIKHVDDRVTKFRRTQGYRRLPREAWVPTVEATLRALYDEAHES